MPGETIIYYIGAFTAIFVAVSVLFAIIAIIFGMLAYKANLFIFPGLSFFMFEKLRPVFKMLFSFFSRDRHIVERIAIKLLNRIHNRKYLNVSKNDRVVILPQCLRDLECEARLDPSYGLVCKHCGKCVIDKVSKLNGTSKVYISPGGTFAIRILEASSPSAVLGVACPRDLFEGMSVCHSMKIPVQGVMLLRTGCVATEVDFEKVAETLLVEPGKANA